MPGIWAIQSLVFREKISWFLNCGVYFYIPPKTSHCQLSLWTLFSRCLDNILFFYCHLLPSWFFSLISPSYFPFETTIYPSTMGLWESSLACPKSGDSPYTDLLSFVFQGPVEYDQSRPLFIDAENPSRSLNASQFRLLVRTLIAGLKAHHVQRGDCVLVHLGNNVSS